MPNRAPCQALLECVKVRMIEFAAVALRNVLSLGRAWLNSQEKRSACCGVSGYGAVKRSKRAGAPKENLQ